MACFAPGAEGWGVYACRFFAAEGCKLRMGAYTSLNTLCTYLESDVGAEGQGERNFWVWSLSRLPFLISSPVSPVPQTYSEAE